MGEKVFAKNLAGKAEQSLLKSIPNVEKRSAKDAKGIELVLKIMNKGVHFAMPADGKLFDDNLKGIRGEKLRLPYKNIIVEYEREQGDLAAPNASVVYAQEYINKKGKDEITVVSARRILNNKWELNPIGLFIVAESWDPLMPINKKIKGFNGKPVDNKEKALACSPFSFMPDLYEYIKGLGESNLLDSFIADMVFDADSVLELVEALSCSNVSTTTLQNRPRKKTKGKRKNKPPYQMYETKVLTINTPRVINSGPPQRTGKKHASPRQHLRRGHIRRLKDRKIWVNSCVVGTKGFINKSYKVKNKLSPSGARGAQA